MSHTGRLTKGSIKKESSYGSIAVTDTSLSVTGPSVMKENVFVEDPRFIGQNFTSAQVKVASSVKGTLPLTAHPQEVGKLTFLTLMKEATPVVGAQGLLVIYYTGTDAYADVAKPAGSLIGSSGANVGAKATAFTFDTANASYDTLAEMAAAITAVAGGKWTAIALGYGAALTSLLGTVGVTQVFTNNACILPLTSASGTAYLHKITPAGPTDTDVSFTYCQDLTIGAGKALSYSGCKINSFKLDIPPKQIVKLSLDVIGQLETQNITYPAITLPVDKPFFGSSARLFIGGLETTLAKTLNLDIAMSLDTEFRIGNVDSAGYGTIIEPIRAGSGTCRAKISGSIDLDSTQWAANYGALDANTNEEVLIYLENVDYADTTNKVKYSMLFRIAQMTITKYATPPSGPGRLTSSIDGEAVYTPNYQNIEVWVQDIVAAY